MISTYLIKLYVATLLTGPIIFGLYEAVKNGVGQLLSTLAFFPVIYIFAVLFSIPTLLLGLASIHLMDKSGLSTSAIKFCIVLVAILGMVLTLYLIGGSLMLPLGFSYGLAIVLSVLGFYVYDSSKPSNHVRPNF